MKQPILVVDDEAPTRELLSLYFRKRGLEVTTAKTVQEAREAVASAPVCLAILDVNLAGENGLELLGFFRTNHPTVPIIIFTGLKDEGLVEKALAGGACGVMSKSEPLDSLYKTVCRHLPQ